MQSFPCRHYAAAEGRAAPVSALLAAGAQPESPSARGITPMQVAAAEHHAVAVKVLALTASPDTVGKKRRVGLGARAGTGACPGARKLELGCAGSEMGAAQEEGQGEIRAWRQ